MYTPAEIPESVAVAAREASNRIERSAYHSRNPQPIAIYSTPKGWFIQPKRDKAPANGLLQRVVSPTIAPPTPNVHRANYAFGD